jgi:sec-independent protein translocase protein TatA
VFGSIGGTELLVLAAIGLLVFGPRRLPEMGRTLAKTLLEIRKAAGDMTSAIQQEVDLSEVRRAAGDLQTTLQQKAGRLVQDLEAEARAVNGAAEKVGEREREPGGPAAP